MSTALLDLVPDIIFEYRLVPEPGFVYVTPSVTAIVGYSPDEHYADPQLGRRIVHPDDLPLLDEIASGPDEDAVYCIRWQARSGAEVKTAQRLRAVRDQAGTLVGIVGVCRPVDTGRPEWVVDFGAVRVDLASHRASVDGREMRLTPSEYQILALLASASEPVTKRDIVERLWGEYHSSGEHAVEVHVSNLRKKLEPDPDSPRRLVTVRGEGYRLAGHRSAAAG